MISLLALLLCGAVSAYAEVPSGLSVGAGLGSMFAVDEQSYLGSGTDLYPECFVSYDRGPLAFELSAGWLYREGKIKLVLGNVVLSETKYTEAFFPVELAVKYLPMKMVKSDGPLQPFLGLGAGMLFASGDNDENFFFLSPDLGLSFGKRHIFELDCAYNLVLGDDDLDLGANLDYLKLSLRYKYRFAFGAK